MKLKYFFIIPVFLSVTLSSCISNRHDTQNHTENIEVINLDTLENPSPALVIPNHTYTVEENNLDISKYCGQFINGVSSEDILEITKIDDFTINVLLEGYRVGEMYFKNVKIDSNGFGEMYGKLNDSKNIIGTINFKDNLININIENISGYSFDILTQDELQITKEAIQNNELNETKSKSGYKMSLYEFVQNDEDKIQKITNYINNVILTESIAYDNSFGTTDIVPHWQVNDYIFQNNTIIDTENKILHIKCMYPNEANRCYGYLWVDVPFSVFE